MRAVPALREWAAADDRAAGRTLAFTAACAAVATLVFALLPLSAVIREAEDGHVYLPVTAEEIGWLVLYIALQLVPIGVTIGFSSGVLFALRGRQATLRARRSIVAIAIACALLIVAWSVWVAPVAMQAFQDLITHRPNLPGRPMYRRDPASSGARMEDYSRWASLVGPIVLGLFAHSLSAFTRGKAWSIAIGIPASVVYVSFYILLAWPVLTGRLSPFIAAWIPNVVFALMTVALVRLKPDTTSF
jgi:hypothetical protein